MRLTLGIIGRCVRRDCQKNEATQYLRAKSVAFKNELLFARNITTTMYRNGRKEALVYTARSIFAKATIRFREKLYS